MDEQKAVRRVGQMFKQTSNYLNSISNLQGVPFFAALTPSFLLLPIYIYVYVGFFSLISGAHHSFRVLEDVVGSSRVKSTSRASVPLCVDEVPTLADSSGVATRFSNRNWRSFLFFFL